MLLPQCPPGVEGERLGQEIRAWVSSPPMRDLVGAFGCGVDTVGFDPARVGAPFTTAGIEAHLQEMRSAIRSMRKLHDRL